MKVYKENPIPVPTRYEKEKEKEKPHTKTSLVCSKVLRPVVEHWKFPKCGA
jgi:hypothetical protein